MPQNGRVTLEMSARSDFTEGKLDPTGRRMAAKGGREQLEGTYVSDEKKKSHFQRTPRRRQQQQRTSFPRPDTHVCLTFAGQFMATRGTPPEF